MASTTGCARSPPSAHQFSLGADPFEEHHELELEKDLRIDGWSPTFLIRRTDQVADEAQVQLGLEVAVEVVGRDQGLKRLIA